MSGALDYQLYTKTHTHLLENQIMKSNHSTAVRKMTTVHNVRMKENIRSRKNKTTTSELGPWYRYPNIPYYDILPPLIYCCPGLLWVRRL